VHSVDFRLPVSVVVVIIASMSVSKGFAWCELDGVERSDGRGSTFVFSAEGVITSEPNVSCEGFGTSRVVVSTVKPDFSCVEAMVTMCDGNRWEIGSLAGSNFWLERSGQN